MKKYKKLTYLFGALAIVLSNIMCAVTSYNYCKLTIGAQYAAYSAPPWVAFLLCIPYIIGMIICVIAALSFHKKSLN